MTLVSHKLESRSCPTFKIFILSCVLYCKLFYHKFDAVLENFKSAQAPWTYFLQFAGASCVFGCDGVPVEVDMIVKMVDNCPYLKGRPKFFIVQACRGRKCENFVFNMFHSQLTLAKFMFYRQAN